VGCSLVVFVIILRITAQTIPNCEALKGYILVVWPCLRVALTMNEETKEAYS
jgi:hypothetical protein